jgi:RES domain-containing protein
MAAHTVWRLTHERYAESAFSGEGAKQYGGRFNSSGTAVVYTSENLPLALLETLTGLERYTQLYDYVFFRASVPDELVSEVAPSELPEHWDRHPPPSQVQQFGDNWVDRAEAVALRVPSVVVPSSINYVLNPSHPEFQEVDIGPQESFPVDQRLVPDE